MIFLIHYTLEIDDKLCEVKKGLMWGGNPVYVFEAVCSVIGYPISFDPDNIVDHNRYIFTRDIKKPNGETIDIISEKHTICIAPPGEMFTAFKCDFPKIGGE